MRTGGEDDELHKDGGKWHSGVWYSNLPINVNLPMYGTSNMEGNDENTVVLSRHMVVYMIRAHHWSSVDTSGWTLIHSGKYLEAPNITNLANINIYTKTMSVGTHTIDSKYALYLFDQGKHFLKFATFVKALVPIL